MSSNLKVNTILPSTGTTVTVSGISSVTSSISAGSSITVTTFYGSGANLTSLPSQLTLSNNADNRVITGGSGTNLNGESTLTYDGSTLTVKGASNTTQAVFSGTGGSGSRGLEIVTETVGATDEGVILNARASGTTGRIKMQTNDVTAMTIDGSGSNGNVTLNTGNLVIGTSGKGIDFSATANATVMGEGFSTTAPTMDNELLKSYERGTWTGTIRGYDHAGGAGWGNVATTAGTNSATGRYMKIGNLVTCFIKFSGITWDTSWTYFSIVGVPFGHNHYDGAGGFCLAQDTNSFTNTGMTVMGNVMGSQGYLVGQQPNGTTNLTLDTSNSNRIITASLVFYTSTGG